MAIDKVEWSTNTDGAGRFEWDSAPKEPLAYSFLAEGFNRVYALKLQTSVMVKAGGVTQVVLGVGGRPVIGTALLAGATASIEWQNVPVRPR